MKAALEILEVNPQQRPRQHVEHVYRYLKHFALRTFFKEQGLLVERLQGLACNLSFLFGFTCSVFQQVDLDVRSWAEWNKKKEKEVRREKRWAEVSCIRLNFRVIVTWEGFGARFRGKASRPDHLDLQLTFLIHQPDLNITCWGVADTNASKNCLWSHVSKTLLVTLLLQSDPWLTHCRRCQRLAANQLTGTQSVQEVAELAVGSQSHPWEDQTETCKQDLSTRSDCRARHFNDSNSKFNTNLWQIFIQQSGFKHGTWEEAKKKGHMDKNEVGQQERREWNKERKKEECLKEMRIEGRSEKREKTRKENTKKSRHKNTKKTTTMDARKDDMKTKGQKN